jgi:hypothetical protein
MFRFGLALGVALSLAPLAHAQDRNCSPSRYEVLRARQLQQLQLLQAIHLQQLQQQALQRKAAYDQMITRAKAIVEANRAIRHAKEQREQTDPVERERELNGLELRALKKTAIKDAP